MRDAMDVALIVGTANPELGARIAVALNVPPVACAIQRFPDGEVSVDLQESVRGREVCILLPTAPPVNDHLVELLAVADACRRAAAARITAIIPYFGYARSDKRQGHRTPVMARVVADLMQSVGIAHVITVDAHAPQIEGFFSLPIDDVSAIPTIADALRPHIAGGAVIVSPDLGGIWRAAEYSRLLDCPTAVCVKHRTSGTRVAVSQVIGAVLGHRCVIVDDMITTGGTIAECAAALRDHGARPGFCVAATHAVLAPGACERLLEAGVGEVLVTDTIASLAASPPFLTRVTIAPLLAETVARVMADRSLHDLQPAH